VQRATAQSKTGFFRDYGVAEAPPGFQAGWSDCTYYFSFFLFILFAHLGFPCTFCALFIFTYSVLQWHLRFSRSERKTFSSSTQVKSSYKSPLIPFALCKEQQHSQKWEFFVIMV
jgi:hypothetical protein